MTGTWDEAVAVVGIGCIYPGAADADQYWRNVAAGVDCTGVPPADRCDPELFATLAPAFEGAAAGSRSAASAVAAGTATLAPAPAWLRGGFLSDDALRFEPGRFGIMPVAIEGSEPDQLLALATAAAAIDDLGGLDGVDRARVGVLLGRGGYLTPGLVRLDQQVRTSTQLLHTLRTLLPDVAPERLATVRDTFAGQIGELSPDAAIGLVPNLAASRIANRLDLGGPAYTVDAACASSLLAVDSALGELRSGRCDLVLAGGVHHCHDVTLWSVFAKLGALSATGTIRPYSRHADGVLVGEGTGMVVLERLSQAERLGHRVYAVIPGTGMASDGRDASLMSPRVQGQVLALERAYQDAGIDPATVGLVEGHGTATVAGDKAELDTIRQIFGAAGPSGARAVLGSVKSQIGHAMPAAGIAGLIKAVLAVYHGVLPPTRHGEDPHPALADTRFRLLGQAEPWEQPDGPRRAGVNAFGFGGINAHVIVQEHDPLRRSRPAAQALARTAPAPGNGPATGRAKPGSSGAGRSSGAASEFRFRAILLEGRDADDLAAQLAAVDPDHLPPPPARSSGERLPARLAIVDPDARRLQLAARALAKNKPWRGRNDLFFAPRGLIAEGGKLAFLFPGVEPNFDADVSDVSAWFGRQLPPIPPDSPPLEVQGRQIFAAGRLLNDVLGELAVVPDHVAGHSLGEWTAVFADEMVPSDQADSFLDGLQPGSLEVPGVVFVALGCGVGPASEAIADLPDVVVSHDNCPHQSVICGPPEQMATATERLAARKVVVQEMPFRSGFHSPAFAPYLGPVHHHWGRMPLQAGRVPMWSATTCERYPDDPAAVRQLAADHLVRPVLFRPLVERLYAEGIRAFVQLGTGSLAAFVEDTLRDRDHLSLSAHTAKQTGMGQLARVAAGLWVEGIDVRFDRLLAPAAGGAVAAAPVGAAPRRPHGPVVRLSLGSALVDLPGSMTLSPAAPPAVVGPLPAWNPSGAPGLATADGLASGHPLGAAHDALLAEALAASQAVAGAFVAAPPGQRRPAGSAAANGVAVPAALPPAAGTAATPRSPRAGAPNGTAPPAPDASKASEAVGRLQVSLETYPWLVDHCFYRQPAGWPDAADRFPVVPMTTMVELLAGAARRLVPGRHVVRIANIRAMRWLPAAPAREVTIRAVLSGPDQVDASIEGYTRATVHLAPEWPAPPAPAMAPLVNPKPSPVGPVALYEDHHMFHGPTFQGVRVIEALGDDGIDGVIESLPTPGAFLDNAGQLYGWWVMATATQDFLALPQSIEAIELYGPQPPVGAPVATRVRITGLDARTVKSDIELEWDGRVVVRIIGWVDRRFDSDEGLWLMLRLPEDHLLASPMPGGVLYVDERWKDSASRELLARRYFHASELAAYEAMNPRRQRSFLLGRIAAKDAVRKACWDAGHGDMFPAELTVGNEPSGRPFVSGSGTEGLHVSLAHCQWVGVALVGTRPDLGVDVERIEPRSEQASGSFVTDAERALLPVNDDEWLTRAWSAKEAAAKAAGTGLGGRPKDFVINAVDGERLLVGDRWVSTVSMRKEHVVAWTDPNP